MNSTFSLFPNLHHVFMLSCRIFRFFNAFLTRGFMHNFVQSVLGIVNFLTVPPLFRQSLHKGIKLHAQYCAPRSLAKARAHEVFAHHFRLPRRGEKMAHLVFLLCFCIAKKESPAGLSFLWICLLITGWPAPCRLRPFPGRYQRASWQRSP